MLQCDRFRYIVYGRERGANDTPHLQCYAEFPEAIRLTTLKTLLPRAHFELARGTPKQASDYCKKDGDFVERGTMTTQGKRTDLEQLRDAINDGERNPKRLRQDYIAACKYPSLVRQLLIDTRPPPPAPDITLRPWQSDLIALFRTEPDPRHIHFVVDPQGGCGKSTFCDYVEATFDHVQVIKPSRYQDMAYELFEDVRILLIDCPRSRVDVLQYHFLEDVKDRRVSCSKFESYQKRLPPCHLVVMTNEEPDAAKLSPDRLRVVRV